MKLETAMDLLFISAILSVLLCTVTGQGDWGSFSGQGPVTNTPIFYMDSSTHCSLNQPFEVDMATSLIYGKHSSPQSSPVTLTECAITLKSDKQREKRAFSVEIEDGTINSDTVEFIMYNGDSTSSNRLFILAKGKNVDRTRKYNTAGGFVTFYLRKQSPSDLDFNIKLIVRVIPQDITDNDQCKTGNEYGCRDYGYKTPIEKEVIIGIVGGIFGLIMFIIIPIIIIYCYRKSKGVTKRWDEFHLSDTNTAADIHSSSASLTKSKKAPWTSQSSRAPYSDYKKSVASRSRYSDDDSVFSGSTDMPPKYRPPPPPYDEHDRGRSYRDGPRSYRSGRDDRFNRNDRDNRYNRNDRDDRYSRKDRYDDRSERSYRSRDSDRRSQKSYFSSSDDASFVQGRDDHPQEVFIERVIEPRVKPMSKAEKQKRAEYDDDEDPYDKIVEDSPKSKPKKTVKESAMQCEEESSDENESNTESDEEPPSTDETDEDDVIKKKEMEAKKSALYAKPIKSGKKKATGQPPAPVPQPVQGTLPVPAGGVPMVPGQPVFFAARPPLNGPQMFPQPVHPTRQPFFNQPHTRPFMSISAVPRQPAMVQGFPQPPMSARLPPPQQQLPPPMHSASQAPQQPPVFTHLVQRGYGRQSPSVDSSEGRNQTDESNMAGNLGSGVEFMKRTTTTV